MSDFRLLLRNLRPYGWLFGFAFLLMAMVGLFEAGRTALLKSIIDLLSTGQNATSTGLAAYLDVPGYLPSGTNALPVMAGLLVAFTLIRGSSEYFSNVLMWRIGVSVVVDLRQRLYEHILQQSSEFFTDHPTNTLTTPRRYRTRSRRCSPTSCANLLPFSPSLRLSASSTGV